jgi:hypothetical protein
MTQANFFARLVDQNGLTVPGSVREGHNVFVDVGRSILRDLIVWDTIGPPDTARTDRRIRWAGVGTGTQNEDRNVITLVTPLQVTAGGDYLKAIDSSLTRHPTITILQHTLVFATTELSHSGDVVITEAGLYADSNPGLTLNPALSTNELMFYKTFEGLVKTPAFSLEIVWEQKF